MNNSIGHEFLMILNNIRKLSMSHHPKIKIHMGELMMLGTIHGCWKQRCKDHTDEPGVKVGELSELIHSTKPATSKMLRAIEAKGYIERVTDTKDRRVVYIRLTEVGETIIKDSLKMMDDFTVRTVERMGEEDTIELIRLLKKFYQAMSEELKDKSTNNE